LLVEGLPVVEIDGLAATLNTSDGILPLMIVDGVTARPDATAWGLTEMAHPL
jgi:hypothetical protein